MLARSVVGCIFFLPVTRTGGLNLFVIFRSKTTFQVVAVRWGTGNVPTVGTWLYAMEDGCANPCITVSYFHSPLPVGTT